MKKSKLLMPLIGIAALGAAITPMAVLTSCNKATITELTIDTDNAVTDYYYGDRIDTNGLVINAKYSDGSTHAIDHNRCEFTPSLETYLTSDDKKVTVKFDGKEATYDIVVWEDLLNYVWREDVKPGQETINENTANDYYFKASNVAANVRDDVFWHLSKYARATNALFTLEEYGKEVLPEIQEYVTAAIKALLGDKFGYIGYLGTASGQVDNVTLKEYDATNHIAYISADIIMNLEAKMVDRDETEGTLTDNGAVTIESIHHLTNIPYSIQYNKDEGGWLVYPVTDMIAEVQNPKTPKYSDWEITRDWFSAWIDKNGNPDSERGPTMRWYTGHRVNTETEGIAGNPLDFISWNAYYLENYKHQA